MPLYSWVLDRVSCYQRFVSQMKTAVYCLNYIDRAWILRQAYLGVHAPRPGRGHKCRLKHLLPGFDSVTPEPAPQTLAARISVAVAYCAVISRHGRIFTVHLRTSLSTEPPDDACPHSHPPPPSASDVARTLGAELSCTLHDSSYHQRYIAAPHYPHSCADFARYRTDGCRVSPGRLGNSTLTSRSVIDWLGRYLDRNFFRHLGGHGPP